METVCSSCGAPAKPGIILCEFCEAPINAEAAKRAICCKQCQTLNVETAQQCMKCKQWLVVQCLFCNHLTRNDAPACVRCNEPFAGAAERKAARDAEAKRQQMFQMAGAVAPIAGSLLGGVAGAVLGNSFGGNQYGGNQYGGNQYGGHSNNYGGHSPGFSGGHSMGEGFRDQPSYSSHGNPSHGSPERERWGSDDSSSSSGSNERGFFESVADTFSSGSSSREESSSSSGSNERGFFESVAESFSGDSSSSRSDDDEDDEGGRG